MSGKTEKKRGRPVEKMWPELIPDTPENVMLAVLVSPPRKESDWKYLSEAKEPE